MSQFDIGSLGAVDGRVEAEGMEYLGLFHFRFKLRAFDKLGVSPKLSSVREFVRSLPDGEVVLNYSSCLLSMLQIIEDDGEEEVGDDDDDSGSIDHLTIHVMREADDYNWLVWNYLMYQPIDEMDELNLEMLDMHLGPPEYVKLVAETEEELLIDVRPAERVADSVVNAVSKSEDFQHLAEEPVFDVMVFVMDHFGWRTCARNGGKMSGGLQDLPDVPGEDVIGYCYAQLFPVEYRKQAMLSLGYLPSFCDVLLLRILAECLAVRRVQGNVLSDNHGTLHVAPTVTSRPLPSFLDDIRQINWKLRVGIESKTNNLVRDWFVNQGSSVSVLVVNPGRPTQICDVDADGVEFVPRHLYPDGTCAFGMTQPLPFDAVVSASEGDMIWSHLSSILVTEPRMLVYVPAGCELVLGRRIVDVKSLVEKHFADACDHVGRIVVPMERVPDGLTRKSNAGAVRKALNSAGLEAGMYISGLPSYTGLNATDLCIESKAQGNTLKTRYVHLMSENKHDWKSSHNALTVVCDMDVCGASGVVFGGRVTSSKYPYTGLVFPSVGMPSVEFYGVKDECHLSAVFKVH